MPKYGRHFMYALIFIFLSPCLFAQDPLADDVQLEDWNVTLLPLWGENAGIAERMVNEMFTALEDIEYIPHLVDISNLPSGVPPGGLPPYMSPRPMLGKEQTLAITGSVSFSDMHNMWLLHLYLWQVQTDSLLLTDQFATPAGEDEEIITGADVIMPTLIGYLMSRRPPDKKPPYDLLYLGLRLGWNFQAFTQVFGDRQSILNMANANLAASLNLQFFGFEPLNSLIFGFGTAGNLPLCFLGLQVEGIAMQDFDGNAFSVTVPAMLTFTVRKPDSFFALQGGGYFIFPIPFQMMGGEPGIVFGAKGETMPYGWTAGLSYGIKQGPGFITFGLRWYGDMFSSILETTGNFYNRNSIGVSIGYELGMIEIR